MGIRRSFGTWTPIISRIQFLALIMIMMSSMSLSTIAVTTSTKFRGQREGFRPLLDRMVPELRAYEEQNGNIEVDEVEERCAGCVVFSLHQETKELMVLLIKAKAGWHSFPKGHLDEGEDDITGAVRETQEETGLQITKEEVSEESPLHVRYAAFTKLHKDTWRKHPDYPDDSKRPKVIVYKTVVQFTAFTDKQELVPQVEEVADSRFYPIEEAMHLLDEESKNQLQYHAISDYVKSKLHSL